MTLHPRFTGPVRDLDPQERDLLLERSTTFPDEVRETVEHIAERIQRDGDEALVAYTERFDDVRLDALTVPDATIRQALKETPAGFEDAFTQLADQIEAYHEALTGHEAPRFEARGIRAHERIDPLPRAGVYAPGGTAAYPSTVAMTVIPAQVAGVQEITVASPPGPDGAPHALVLAACHLLDVDRVIPLGGAQAILALAHGTQTLPDHPVVVGPGNAYVQAAKEHIAGQVRIDAPAGPSEIAALVGPHADPRAAARELAAQAEHAPDTQAVAVCLDPDVADAIPDLLDRLASSLDRGDTIRASLETNGAVLTAPSSEEAVAFLDELAPEHCVILHEDAGGLAETLTRPACIVTGRRPRVPLADYGAGPSHVLPTGGRARAFSGIGLDTFTKRVHIVDMADPDPALVDAATRMARWEGLTAHAHALEPTKEEEEDA